MDTDRRYLAEAPMALLGGLSLGWQAATFVLTGGRVKPTLKIGAVAAIGTGMVLMDLKKVTHNELQNVASQGFTRPIIAIVVRNVGRLPVTVNRWGLRAKAGATFEAVGESIGPNLPHRLDTGISATWAFDLYLAIKFAQTTGEVLGDGQKAASVVGTVQLGDGRTRTTAESYRP